MLTCDTAILLSSVTIKLLINPYEIGLEAPESLQLKPLRRYFFCFETAHRTCQLICMIFQLKTTSKTLSTMTSIIRHFPLDRSAAD